MLPLAPVRALTCSLCRGAAAASGTLTVDGRQAAIGGSAPALALEPQAFGPRAIRSMDLKQRARYVIALAMAFTLLATGTALAHPDHPDHPDRPGAAEELFPGEGVRPVTDGGKNDEGDGGHLEPKQENVNIVGKAEVTNPARPDDPAGNDGRVTDVFAYDHPDLPDGEQSYAYLGAFFQTQYEDQCEATGVHVIDINDLENPVEVEDAFVQTSPGNYVGEGVQVIRIDDRDILIHQNETCTTATAEDGPFGGINLYDVTDPLNAETLTAHVGDAVLDDQGEPTGSSNTVHSFYAWYDQEDDATYAVLVDNEELTDVDIMDISDPENPVLINDTLDLAALFGVEQESPDNLTSIFSHDFDVQRTPDGRYIMVVNYWDGGYVLLDVTDPTPGDVTLVQETDFEELDPERLARGEEIAPEGNGHQGEQSPDFEYLIGTDEDFAPFRFEANLDDGTEIAVGVGDDGATPEQGATFTAEAGDIVFLGSGCTADGPLLPAADTGVTIGMVERGACTFSEKVGNVEAAGYGVAVVVNSSVAGNCSVVINMSTPGDITIPGYFVGRDTGFALFGDDTYDEDACQTGTQVFPAAEGDTNADGQGFTVASTFEGWGYVRLYDTDIEAEGETITETVDTYAVPESQDAAFAQGFGDLSVHEVAIDPNRIPSADEPGLAYISYYSAGFRVVEYGPDGIDEVGALIDTEGNNFWGVEVYERDGETFALASDRDYGLYIFDYLEDDEPIDPIDPIDPAPMDPETDTVTRVAGDSRIDTAIAVSQEFYETASAVVLARDDIFPDSLSGSPLAIDEDAPLLLTGSDALDERTADEIDRVLTPETGTAETATVYLLGGEDALSAQVEDDVEALGYDVVRYGGRSRFETAAIIAEDGLDSPDTVLLADGNDFPDAVSAGAAGGVADAAVLLTGSESPSDDTDAYLAAQSPTTFAVGGPAATAYPDAEPLVGETRFETSVLVAETFFESATVVGLATGGDFADALAGGAAVGALGGPLLLTGQDNLPESTEGYLIDNAESIDDAYVFGGTDVISESVVDQTRAAIADSAEGGDPDESQTPPG